MKEEMKMRQPMAYEIAESGWRLAKCGESEEVSEKAWRKKWRLPSAISNEGENRIGVNEIMAENRQ